MTTFSAVVRQRLSGVLFLMISCRAAIVAADEVIFDLPSTIECRDITTPAFAAANPNLKLVEARLRISARMLTGNASTVVDFEYFFRTGRTMRVRDYLPTTTLESSVAEDNIEITSGAEQSKSGGLDAQIAYKPVFLGASLNQTAKKTESSKYKQIAAKDTVLASGTIDREHGVFFRIRPSRNIPLEGGREFSFVAEVPRAWRGDICTITCSARGTKKNLIATSVAPIGESQLQVGMYLAGDVTAATIADELRLTQSSHNELTASQAKNIVLKTFSTESNCMWTTKKAAQEQQRLRDATKAFGDVQTQLEALAR